MAKASDEPALVSGHFVYSRESKDRPWAILYLAALAFTIIGGIVTIKHRNPLYKHATEAYMSDPHNCPYTSRGRNLLRATAAEKAGVFDVSEFLKDGALWLGVSAGGAIVVGVLFLQMFRKYAGAMTRATIVMQVVTPLVVGIVALASGSLIGGGIMVGLAALTAFTFYLWRNEIELCSRLLGVSAQGLHDNPALVLFVVIAQLASAVGAILLLGMSVLSYEHGDVAPNGARTNHTQCVNAEGSAIPCCVWAPSGWAKAYMSISGLVLLWTMLLFAEVRVFVVSGTIAQWYFQPAGANSNRGTTLRSLKHALGPSFGSLALGSAILTAVQIARQAMEQARQNARNGEGGLLAIAISIAGCVLECFYTLIEVLTKFATVMMAITGESFLDAGRGVTDLLVRNFLKAYGVWWFPPLVIQLGAFMLSAAWGAVLYAMTYFALGAKQQGHMEAIVLGVLAFIMALVVLTFFGSVMLNIVDAVFICFALDRDTQTISHPEVHEVFSLLPVGAVIEQPDGELQYGAPQHVGSPRAGGRISYVPPAQQEGMVPQSSNRGGNGGYGPII